MEQENCKEPERELCYFSLISRCNDLIDSIGRKTSFIQNSRPSSEKVAVEKPFIGSQLEEKLKKLVERLEELNISFKL